MNAFRSASRGEKSAVVALVLATLFFLVRDIVHQPFQDTGVDFPTHWLAAKAMQQGQSPYYGEHLYLGYNYPMFLAIIWYPLAWVPTVEAAEKIWDATNVLLVLLAGAALGWWLWPARALREGPGPEAFLARWWTLVVAFFLASYEPLHVVLYAANIEPWNLFFGGMFVVCMARRWDARAGVFLALFALIKVAPVLLILGVLGLRRYRAAAAFGATLAAYGLLLLVTGWWRWESALYTDTLPNIPHNWQGISLSIHRFLADSFAPEILGDAKRYGRFIFLLNVPLGMVYAACCAWQWWRRRADEELFLAFACFYVLLLSPLVEVTHFTWVAPAILLQLRAFARRAVSPGVFVMLAGLWVGVFLLHFILHWNWLPGDWATWKYQTIVLVYCVGASGAAAFLTPREGRATAPAAEPACATLEKEAPTPA